MTMDVEIELSVTKKALDYIYFSSAITLAEHTYKKFNGKPEGKFNRYLTADHNGNGRCFLVIFESDIKATVMTYEEAMGIPVLAKKCKEVWND